MFLQALQIEPAVEHPGRQILDERYFRPAEPAGAYLVVGERHHTVWGGPAIRREPILEAPEDRRRRLDRELLRRDRHAQRDEGVLRGSGVQLARSDTFDDVSQRRIGFHQVTAGGGVIGWHDSI